MRAGYLFKIFLFIGFVLVSTRIERFHSQGKYYCDNPIQVINELPLSEQSDEAHYLLVYEDGQKDSSARTDILPGYSSYTYSILSYKVLILTRYKVIVSNTYLCYDIISVIQKSNIWHKSSPKEHGLS